jgi:hypothetical protein
MSSPRNFNDDDQSPATPKTPRATRHSRSRDDESLKKPQKAVSFKKFAPESPPLAPKALSFADIDSSTTTTEPAVRKNSRQFRRSVSPAPADKDQAVVVAKPRERQADHWVKFHKVSLGRARTAKMNHNEAVVENDTDDE